MADLSDQELIRKVTNGHPEAFNEIVRRYQDKLFNAVIRHVGDYNDAHDIVQQSFLNAYRNLRSFKEESNLGTWLYRIAFNQSVSFFRSRGRNRAVSFDGRAAQDGEVGGFEPAAEADPSAGTARAELRDRIQEALLTLDDESRRIVILREFEGCDYVEIARVMEVPIGTVRSRLHRARLALKSQLAGWEASGR
jgi:RNA polymerase sigma-70 factor (ECF subfamily)